MITSAQMRAARALLDWKQEDLAAAAGISVMTIKNMERGKTGLRAITQDLIERAFAEAGVLFLEPGVNRDGGAGVRLRGETK